MNKRLTDTRELTAFFYYLVILVAILFYLGWGIRYHGSSDGAVWTDIGVISVFIVLMGFGLVGSWLYHMKLAEEENSY